MCEIDIRKGVEDNEIRTIRFSDTQVVDLDANFGRMSIQCGESSCDVAVIHWDNLSNLIAALQKAQKLRGEKK